MDAPNYLSSPRSRRSQGPRLAVSKDSHKIENPTAAVTPPLHGHDLKQPPPALHRQHPRRAPTITYYASPKVIVVESHDFRALVQRLTGPGAAAAPACVDPKELPVAPPPVPARFQPPEFLRLPAAVPLPPPYGSDDFLAGVVDSLPCRRGILSPAVLPPVASSWQFSLPPLNASHLSWLGELFPFLRTAGTTRLVEGLGAPFVLDNKQHSLPLATPAMAPPPQRRPSFSSSSASVITSSAGDRPPGKRKMHLFDKVLTARDVGKRLVIPNKEDAAWFFFPPAASSAEDKSKGAVLSFEDPKGKRWSFRCSYSMTRQRYAMTKGWSRFVKKKRLRAGDTVSFYRGLGEAGQVCFFVDWKHSRRVRKKAPMISPSWELGDSCSASSTRRLCQQLVRVRNTISPSSGARVSFAWLTNIKSLATEAEECLRDLYYRMMLAILGVRNNRKVRSSVLSGNSSKTTSSRFFQIFQSASPAELTVVSVAAKLEGLKHGRPELSVAAHENSSKLISVDHLILRCIVLCRGVLGIMSIAGAEARETRQVLPVFAADDLAYAGREKVSMMLDSQKIPANVTDPVYLLPTFIRSLLYLDLSGCSRLAQVPPSLCTLHNLAALNLSRCYSLHTLPVPLGMLQNLQILVLSNCKKLQNLPVSLCELSKLRLLDLSGCSRIETLPYSFVTLRRMEFLNLSDCRRLKELPQPFGILQKLKYLNLSGCHGLDLDVECKLANLMCVTLSPHSNIQGFSDSFRDLENHLDMSRWWNKSRVHPQCNTKASAFHTYKCHEQSIIETLLSVGSDEGDANSDHTVTSICVVGESGMGKTDLVHRIYNDQLILDTFDLRVWLLTCDKKRLLEDIVEFTTRSYCYDSPMSVLEEILIEELTGKKILIVLDDCDNGSPDLWNDLWKLFNVCSKGSAIIITTKSKEVANLFGAMQTCHLNSLSKEDCFMIFQEHVLGGFDINKYPTLESVGWKAVEKCGGNALCIKALSGLLCHSEIGLSQMDMLVDGILPALRLCYDLLPSHLQECFRFCSLFPKGHNFTKHQIVRLWIAQGFVFPEEGSQLEETGQHYFDELLCRLFFQHSPYHNDKEHKFVMHELFHNLAHSVSKNECFRSEEPFCSLPENISHLSLVPSVYKTVALTKGIRNLQSLLVVRRFFPVIRILHLDEVYVKYIFLRALNLSGTDILQLPSSIRNMKHLGLLALSNTKIKGLPFEIGQLDTLQTLELKDCCHLTDLPESTCNLVKLRHLDIRKEPGNTKVGLPHGIGKLTDLQTLTEFNIANNLSCCSIAELKNLNGLMGHVHITGLENIKTAEDAREANLVGKKFLEALTLEWFYSDEGMNDDLGKEIANDILQNLQPNSNIMELVIRNYAGNLFPVWMQDSYLRNLVSVTLDNCHECSELPYLGYLPFLKSLFIQRMNAVESFGIECNPLATEEKHPPRFPSLEVLTLWEMYDLQFWVGTCEGDFPRIRQLSISRCPKLINLPPLPSLVHLTVHCGGQVPSFSELPSLESLKIDGFHKIRSITFPHQLKMLKKLEISDCKELSSLFAYSLSVSDLKVVRCLKLDLVGSSLEEHHREKVVVGRNTPTRRSMVLKTETHGNVHHDGWQWLKYGEKNIFGSKFPRSYYGCIRRNSTGCIAMKILQPNDSEPNALSVMYISEHNHEFPNEPYLQLSSEHGTTRKRKEPDVSDDEDTTKRDKRTT